MTHLKHYDVIVVGAGFAGLYQLHTLRNQLGLNVHLFEKGSGVGGTWFWNRYPGAMSDTESPFYRYSFDEELLADDTWTRKYINQPDILAYLDSVAERYDLLRSISLNAEITGMAFDDRAEQWTATTTAGERYTARYVVTALGLLAAVNIPKFTGIESFRGRVVHTAQWPADLSTEGKRVGIIGTGSTGAQVICAASQTAARLTVFQRSPQYSVPSGNGPVEDGEVEAYKARFPDIFRQVRSSIVGFGFEESTIPAMSVSAEERDRVFEEAWRRGNGFYFMFGTFSDIATNPEANEAAAAFIRKKIAQIVKDPETAQNLTPHELYAKRPLCNHNYFEVYNQDNVRLVNIKKNPIERVTPTGVLTADGVEHELDILVLATGFDGVDGNYRRMDLRGRGGVTINEHWADAPTSYLGVATSHFPNMFMLMGPNGPFTNIVPAIEVQVEFVTKLIADGVRRGPGPSGTIEVSRAEEDRWTELCRGIADMTLFSKMDSWIFGANIPGKKPSVLFYLGGMANYLAKLAEVEQQGFLAFQQPQPVAKGVAGTVTRVEEVDPEVDTKVAA